MTEQIKQQMEEVFYQWDEDAYQKSSTEGKMELLEARFSNDEQFNNKIKGVLNNFQIYDGGSNYLVCTEDGNVFSSKEKINSPVAENVYIGKDMTGDDFKRAIDIILNSVIKNKIEIY